LKKSKLFTIIVTAVCIVAVALIAIFFGSDILTFMKEMHGF